MAKNNIGVITLFFKDNTKEILYVTLPKGHSWYSYAICVIEYNVRECLKYNKPFEIKEEIKLLISKPLGGADKSYDINNISKILIEKNSVFFKEIHTINIDEKLKKEIEKEKIKEYYQDNFREVEVYIEFDKYIRYEDGWAVWDSITVNTLIPNYMSDKEFINDFRKNGFLKIIDKDNDYKEREKFIDIRKVKTIDINEPKPKEDENENNNNMW